MEGTIIIMCKSYFCTDIDISIGCGRNFRINLSRFLA